MKNIIEYLDVLKEKLGSDYKIAKAMNVNTSTVCIMRKRGQIADETAIKIADLLEIDRTEVLIAASIARSDGEVKKSWEKISRIAGITTIMLLTINDLGINYANPLNSLYIMLNNKTVKSQRLHS